MSSDTLAPKQERSRGTLVRLLKATIDTLETSGLDGATIPKIAAAAGVAPASVYRRFQDRDALLRAAFTTALATGSEGTRAITLSGFKDQSFPGAVAALVGLIIRQYRTAPGLMRAFIRFAEQDHDEAFRSNALEALAGNSEAIVDLMMTFAPEIRHANPRRAVTFALLNVGTVVEAIKVEEVSLWPYILPLDDDELKEELTRMTLAYLRG